MQWQFHLQILASTHIFELVSVENPQSFRFFHSTGTSETSWWCHRIYVLFWECCGSWCLIKHGRNCLKLLLWIKYLISSMFVERVRIHFTFSSPRKNEIFHHFFSNRRQSDGTAYRHDCRKKTAAAVTLVNPRIPKIHHMCICASVSVEPCPLAPTTLNDRDKEEAGLLTSIRVGMATLSKPRENTGRTLC